MGLWCEIIIIIIAKTASTFYNGLAANNEKLVFVFANTIAEVVGDKLNIKLD